MKPNLSRCKTPFSRVTSLLLSMLSLVVLLAFTTNQALAVCYTSSFQDEDGDLSFSAGEKCSEFPAVDAELDWNSFAPIEWNINSAPYREAEKTTSGWVLRALEDDQKNNQDSAFAGGTKQDDACARVKGGKAPNKDDLERAYISHKTVDVVNDAGETESHIILNLGWVRIPQNTTSSSAHIGFEFNQADLEDDSGLLCGGPSDGLVQRLVDDMLIVYDFEGSSTDKPTISMRRWVTDSSATCEVGSSSPPCWGPATNLSLLGFAEAQVNTTLVQTDPVESHLAPPLPPGTTSITKTLGFNEFGEAGIDLTAAGVFTESECLSFGTAFAVSRSSGNSEQAAMKDLVGPGKINLANCGEVIIRKVTIPSPDPTTTTFDFTSTNGLDDDNAFQLQNGGKRDYGAEVFAGEYSVTETDPKPDFALTDINCDASTVSASAISISGATATFTVEPSKKVDCTYTNTLQTGDIEVKKKLVNACVPNDSSTFTLKIGDESEDNKGNDGIFTQTGLIPGSYLVGETNPGDDWTSSISCGDETVTGSNTYDGTVQLDSDDDIKCTVTNIRRPTVKIVKSVADNSKWDLLIDDGDNGFDYEADNKGDTESIGPITITTFNSDTGLFGPVVLGEEAANNDANSTLDGIGTYTAYWRCDNRNGVREANDTDSFTIQQLSPGETITCTVTNIPVAAAACPGS